MFNAYDRGWEACEEHLKKTLYTEEEVFTLLKLFWAYAQKRLFTGTGLTVTDWWDKNKKK